MIFVSRASREGPTAAASTVQAGLPPRHAQKIARVEPLVIASHELDDERGHGCITHHEARRHDQREQTEIRGPICASTCSEFPDYCDPFLLTVGLAVALE